MAIPEYFSADQEACTVMMNPENPEPIFFPSKRTLETTQTDNGGQSMANGEKGSGLEKRSDTKREVDQGRATGVNANTEELWKFRALDAERRADRIFRMVRAGLAPQLARQMMSRLVRELLSQRADWIHAQEVVEQDLAEIERRFVRSHEKLQERLRIFEKRAGELEEALELKAQENNELIKAHIALAQEKLNEANKDQKGELSLWN